MNIYVVCQDNSWVTNDIFDYWIDNILFPYGKFINLLASPSAGAPALKYGDVNTVTPSPGEVKGLIENHLNY